LAITTIFFSLLAIEGLKNRSFLHILNFSFWRNSANRKKADIRKQPKKNKSNPTQNVITKIIKYFIFIDFQHLPVTFLFLIGIPSFFFFFLFFLFVFLFCQPPLIYLGFP